MRHIVPQTCDLHLRDGSELSGLLLFRMLLKNSRKRWDGWEEFTLHDILREMRFTIRILAERARWLVPIVLPQRISFIVSDTLEFLATTCEIRGFPIYRPIRRWEATIRADNGWLCGADQRLPKGAGGLSVAWESSHARVWVCVCVCFPPSAPWGRFVTQIYSSLCYLTTKSAPPTTHTHTHIYIDNWPPPPLLHTDTLPGHGGGV